MHVRQTPSVLALSLLVAAALPIASGSARSQVHLDAAGNPVPECGFATAVEGSNRYLARVAAGELPRPERPVVAPRSDYAGAPGIVTTDDIFLFEDTDEILLGPWTFDELTPLMVGAANALLAAHGDNFDFIGYFLSFEPSSTFGAAFYNGVSNDITGIGDMSGAFGTPSTIFDKHAEFGLAGEAIQGFVMMWEIDSFWAPGAGPDAFFTRLVLGQEFEHRWALFLPDLLDGRSMQGNDANCGRTFHWNWQVDGQGSGMEIIEWVGSSPATYTGLGVQFNTDIPDGVFSYTDLYLMGYVSPAVMDAGNSELRFMETSDCINAYNGPISNFASADIIASAGPRVPDSTQAQKDFRTGWVVFHLPGQPPTPSQLSDVAGILNQHTLDWSTSTLGLGTMDNTLTDPNAFADLGNGLAGTGVPTLVGIGTREGGTEVSLVLTDALPSSSVNLILGFSSLFAPFKFGVLVPSLDVLLAGLPTDGAGALTLSFNWPVGLPSGGQTWWQYWQQDPGGPVGWAASNAIVGTTP